MFGITKVYATAQEMAAMDGQVGEKAATAMANFGPIIMMVILFAVMYFFLIRPQKKKEKEAQAMIAAIGVGDKIVTIGGIWGKVIKVKDEYIFIETGNIGNPDEKTIMKMERQSIKIVLEKKADAKQEEAGEDDE